MSEDIDYNEDIDYMSLSAADFAELEDWQLQQALKQLAGHMAIEQAIMRSCSSDHHRWLAAKEMFAFYKSTASTLQTLLRSMV